MQKKGAERFCSSALLTEWFFIVLVQSYRLRKLLIHSQVTFLVHHYNCCQFSGFITLISLQKMLVNLFLYAVIPDFVLFSFNRACSEFSLWSYKFCFKIVCCCIVWAFNQAPPYHFLVFSVCIPPSAYLGRLLIKCRNKSSVFSCSGNRVRNQVIPSPRFVERLSNSIGWIGF